MTISDLLIIYLACGAPCGVYFFLQNRKKLNTKFLWVKSFLTVFVWIPYAFVLLNDFATKRNQFRSLPKRSASEEKISALQKSLLQFHFNSSSEHSLFEFREVLDRYAGLTTAGNSLNKSSNPVESEFFRIALRENSQLGVECLHRRNYQRLKFHQNLARKDFLQIISELKSDVNEPELLKEKAIAFTEILNDPAASQRLEEIFLETLQSPDQFNVQNLEKGVWKTKEIKPNYSETIPIRLKTFMTATSKKD